MDTASLRAAIPALGRAIYLNTGTFGPSPTVVLDEVRVAYDLIERHGAFSPVVRQALEQDAHERARRESAVLLGVSPDEVTLTRNASDGTNLVAHGLDWKPGDEVAITDQEHPSGVLPWLVLARRSGVRLRVVKVDPDPEVLLERFERQLTGRTRLVFVSHVTSLIGIRLPVEAICRLARARGALAVVDGAHAAGQFPVRPREIGCDAYVTSGHKWLLGPQGASFAYIARERLETFQPSWTGWGAQTGYTLDDEAADFTLCDSARRFEFGTRPWPLYPGLDRAIRFIRDEVTLPSVAAHVRPLAARTKQAVDDLPFARLVTPREPERSAGAVCFEVPAAGDDLRERLWERGVIAAYDPAARCVRLSVACFTTWEELEQALQAVRECVSST